jgi:hypothetical protein
MTFAVFLKRIIETLTLSEQISRSLGRLEDAEVHQLTS